MNDLILLILFDDFYICNFLWLISLILYFNAKLSFIVSLAISSCWSRLSELSTMLNNCHPMVVVLLMIPLILPSTVSSSEHGNSLFTFGAIGDSSSRGGKEERIAIGMAVEDFVIHYGRRLKPLFNNSMGNPTRAAYCGKIRSILSL